MFTAIHRPETLAKTGCNFTKSAISNYTGMLSIACLFLTEQAAGTLYTDIVSCSYIVTSNSYLLHLKTKEKQNMHNYTTHNYCPSMVVNKLLHSDPSMILSQ